MARSFIDVDARGFRRELARNKRALEKLGRAGANRVVRKAVSKAIQPLAKDLKQSVPVRTKLLKRSIGRKVKSYRASGVTAGVAGPRRGFGTTIQGRRRDPVRYAHVVERRTRIWSSVARRHKQSAIRAMARLIKQGIADEIARNGKR